MTVVLPPMPMSPGAKVPAALFRTPLAMPPPPAAVQVELVTVTVPAVNWPPVQLKVFTWPVPARAEIVPLTINLPVPERFTVLETVAAVFWEVPSCRA